jgi:hypothetical protein
MRAVALQYLHMGKNRVFINEYGFVEIIVDGDQTLLSVQAMADKAQRLALRQRKKGEGAMILDNLLTMGEVTPEARNLVVKLGSTMDYDKLAMLGNGKVLRIGTNLMLKAMGRGNKVRYFEDFDNAVEWLHK